MYTLSTDEYTQELNIEITWKKKKRRRAVRPETQIQINTDKTLYVCYRPLV